LNLAIIQQETFDQRNEKTTIVKKSKDSNKQERRSKEDTLEMVRERYIVKERPKKIPLKW